MVIRAQGCDLVMQQGIVKYTTKYPLHQWVEEGNQ